MPDEMLTKVAEREKKFEELWLRMDADLDLFDLAKFQLTDYDGEVVKWAQHVTLNDPKVFAERVVAILSGARPQWEVKLRGVEADEITTSIERFIQAMFYEADELLYQKMLDPLHEFSSFSAAIRGWPTARVEVYRDEESNVKFDILPMDPRYHVWESGPKGLLWSAYKTSRSRESVEDEYGAVDLPAHHPPGADVVLTDVWTPDENIIYVSDRQIHRRDNPFGYVPVIIEPVRLRGLVGGPHDDRLKKYGDSIFAADRGLYADQNAVATILQTLNILSFRPPLGMQIEPGAEMPEEYPAEPGTVTEVAEGEAIKEFPTGDVRRSAPLFYSIINGCIQRGSLVYTEYGNLQFTLSAVAIERLEQHRDQVFVPRLKALQRLYQRSAMMALEQFIKLDEEVEIGQYGEEIALAPKDLKKHQLRINCRLATKSPEKTIASYSVAQGAREFLSGDTVRREVLGLEDPSGEEAKILDELSAQLSPQIMKYKLALAKLRLAEDLEGRDKDAALAEARIMLWELRQEGINVTQTGKVKGIRKAEQPTPEATQALPSGQVNTPKALEQARQPTEGQEVEREEERTMRTLMSGVEH